MNKSYNYYVEEFKSNIGNKTQAKFYNLDVLHNVAQAKSAH